MHDVVIAGASVAGAAIAIHLARMGRSVLLVDRATFPRRKACGEGLFPYGVAELERLGIEARSLGSELRTLRFHSGDATAEAPLGHGFPGLGVQRKVLDEAIVQAAKAAGAEFAAGVSVNGLEIAAGRVRAFRTSEGPLQGRAFVAADGLQSRLRRLAGLENRTTGTRYGISAHVELPSEPLLAIDVYFHAGYEIYRTPLGGRMANVALLLEKAQMHRFAGKLRVAYSATLESHPAIGGPVVLTDEPLAAGPFPRRATRAWRANLVLAGDAAGFFDGISGDGMSTALATAPFCAAAVDQFLDSGDHTAFKLYERQRCAIVRDANLLARLSLTLARRPKLARWAIMNMGNHPQSFARLVALAGEQAGLRSLRPRDPLALLGL